MTIRQKKFVTAVVSNQAGEIVELEGYAAVGMAGSLRVPLSLEKTISLPHGGELLFLPDRSPIVYNIEKRKFETLRWNPRLPDEAVFPVAAFNSPGYLLAYVTGYRERRGAGRLPLFSYGAVGWSAGKFRSAVILVDNEKRQDLRLMQRRAVLAGVYAMRRKMPKNRLRAHLEKCALSYGCPAAKNFFIGRCEAPLPTSRWCNARCMGCLSLQKDEAVPSTQERINFTPTPEEIAEIAIEHIGRVEKGVVSFGQGCEGEPLLAAHVIEPAIRRIRSATLLGTVNMNTNASRPDILDRLFDAGLDSVRVSINSTRESCYTAYFRPKGYRYPDVLRSIDTAIQKRKFVSINYLNLPGFTDSPEEVESLSSFLNRHPIQMIQWRNLNFDPVAYWRLMNACGPHGRPIGMATLLECIKNSFPGIRFGYFNPPKEKFHAMDRSKSRF